MGAGKALWPGSPQGPGLFLPRPEKPFRARLAPRPSSRSPGAARAGSRRGGAPPHPAAMAGRAVLRGAGRALLAGRALPAGPGPCPRRGCGEVAALRAMGFSQEQAQRLLALQPRLGPEHREAAAAQLLLLGLSAEAALALLERSPALLRLPTERLRERAEELRRLGLDGGRLQRAVSRCPELFHVPRKRLEAAVRLLRERCLFTAEQLREVLGTCPTVLLEEPRTLHHQFQYAYFRMGVRQKEMVKARLFQTPFAELRNRHIFLERRGFYETPHKGQTQTSNPKLKDILRLPEKDFLASLAYSTPEEYEVFKKLLAREEEEKEEEDVDALYTEEYDDDDDDDLDSDGSKTARD